MFSVRPKTSQASRCSRCHKHCPGYDDGDGGVRRWPGSQAILGASEDTEPPEVVALSREADIAVLNDPDRRKADAVEGAIGEMSPFHDTHRVFAEGDGARRAVRGGMAVVQPTGRHPRSAMVTERRRTLCNQGGLAGGYTLVNDGPGFAAELPRAIASA